jgi:hypothetical protein
MNAERVCASIMFEHPKPRSSIEKTRLRSNASVHLRTTVKAFLGAADLNDVAISIPVPSVAGNKTKRWFEGHRSVI